MRLPVQEERADPEPTHPAESQRAFRGGQRSGYQNPAHALQFPQIQRVSPDMHYEHNTLYDYVLAELIIEQLGCNKYHGQMECNTY